MMEGSGRFSHGEGMFPKRALRAARAQLCANREGGLFAFNSISQGVLLGAPASHHAKRCFVRKGSQGHIWEILD